jgi:ribosome-associated heat shock protein Hsp15
MPAPHPRLLSGGPPEAGQRLDRWLYFARLVKSRTLAADLILAGKVRVNRARVGKPSQLLRTGEVVTIALRGRVLVLKVLAHGQRRGPAPEARGLYEVLSPVPAPLQALAPVGADRGNEG